MSGRDILTNKEIYQYLSDTFGFNRIKVDRIKAKIKRRYPEMRGHPLKYRGGDWYLSKSEMLKYIFED